MRPGGSGAPSTGDRGRVECGHPRYRVVGILGRGGMGAVYKAEHRLLERPVVLKVIRPDLVATSSLVQRFQREAKLAARMSHPNVVAVYEAEAFGPTQMLVKEYVEGVTLSHLTAERGLLPIAEACELDYIHDQGMVHRDIKPGNVLIEGAQHKVKITDFGLARAADDASISQSGIIAGTPMFMAPEQAQGEHIDHRVDLFSLGSVLYQMVTGRAPFRANGSLAVLKRVAEDGRG